MCNWDESLDQPTNHHTLQITPTMAEALAAIALASSLVQLVTFSSKLLICLTDPPLTPLNPCMASNPTFWSY